MNDTSIDTVPHPAPRRRTPRYRALSGPPQKDPRQQILSSRDVYLQLGDIRNADREHFVAFFLDIRHRIIERYLVSIGTIHSVEVHPREVFRPAIVANAAAIIVAHNHPSGDPSPSPEDRAVTKRLRETGTVVGIALLDHIVVAREGFISLAEESSWL